MDNIKQYKLFTVLSSFNNQLYYVLQTPIYLDIFNVTIFGMSGFQV